MSELESKMEDKDNKHNDMLNEQAITHQDEINEL